jgi:hypothetical protein
VSVHLNAHDRGALRRSGRAVGVTTSVEQGHFGKKTTIQTVTLHT